MDDIDCVLSAMEKLEGITDVIIDDNRRRHVTVLMSETTWSLDDAKHKAEGAYRGGRLIKRTIKRSKSVMDMFLSSADSKETENYKAKNIKQVKNTSQKDLFRDFFA